jgi:putative FmdB family regulatory protein
VIFDRRAGLKIVAAGFISWEEGAMPVYEYGCEAGHRFEVKQKFSDAPIAKCQVCARPVTRLISASAISFKGTGWYLTDYSDKLKPPTAEEKASTPSDKKEPAGTTSPPAESKPAAPAPSSDPKSSSTAQVPSDGSKTAGPQNESSRKP